MDQRGLYKIITKNFGRIDTTTEKEPELPPINDLIKEMILKPLEDEIPEEITSAIDSLESNTEVLEFFYKYVVIDKQESVIKFQKTPNQALSGDWNDARKPRANGSTGDKVAKAKLPSTMWNYWKAEVPLVSSVVYGNTNEDKAADKFQEKNPEYVLVKSGMYQVTLEKWTEHSENIFVF